MTKLVIQLYIFINYSEFTVYTFCVSKLNPLWNITIINTEEESTSYLYIVKSFLQISAVWWNNKCFLFMSHQFWDLVLLTPPLQRRPHYWQWPDCPWQGEFLRPDVVFSELQLTTKRQSQSRKIKSPERKLIKMQMVLVFYLLQLFEIDDILKWKKWFTSTGAVSPHIRPIIWTSMI